MTNEEKAKEIAVNCKSTYLERESDGEVYEVDSYEDCYTAAIEMAKWKEGQYPHWNNQDEHDIYDSFNDWHFHEFVCIMKDGQTCIWIGIYDENADGCIEKHFTPENEAYTIDDISYWTEIKQTKEN